MVFLEKHNKWQMAKTAFRVWFSIHIPTMITVRIAVMPNDINVSVNDVTLTKYPFRGSVVPDKVVKVECGSYRRQQCYHQGQVEKTILSE